MAINTDVPATDRDLVGIDRRTLLHPLLSDDVAERVVIASGEGCRLVDADGREYLDATGGLWLAQVGHGRRELAEVAAAQMSRLEYFTSFESFTNEPAIRLAERLVSLAPESVRRVYFTSGGSEGNDAAIRMARLYFNRRGQPDRTWILSRRDAYHGISYGGGSATGIELFRTGCGPLLPDFDHLTPAWPYRGELFGGQDPTDFLIDELERAIERIGAARIAAFIGEPVMGVAGMLVPPAGYWPRVQETLRRHGILLILDEVVTAYGRIGEWFASSRYGLEPDIVVTAKGISSGYVPLGADLISEEIAETLASDGGFPHGHTYNGHPTACAVGLANLEIIEREQLLEAADGMGAYLLEGLQSLYDLEVVGEVRGVGMMFGIELVADRDTREPLPDPTIPLPDLVRNDTGVIVRKCGHSLVLSPPLVLTRPEADRIVAALRDVLARVRPTGEVLAAGRLTAAPALASPDGERGQP
ncbi:MAG TPA: aspartate aminotransferase family protein [Solirubrobacteraceae bacterium]|nr:aspartate aminotransferase family protein [Solirubrobacteraceae bacterium]